MITPFQSYMKYVESGQLELVLETAAMDRSLPDDEYILLIQAAIKHHPAARRAGKSKLTKMLDRAEGRIEYKRQMGVFV